MGIRSAGIKFSLISALTAAFAGAAVLWLSVVLSAAADSILPLDVTVYISKAVLLFIGIRTLFGDILAKKQDKRRSCFPDCAEVMTDPSAADKDNSKVISAAEGAFMGTALSADSFFTGISAGIAGISPLPIFILSLLFGLAAIALGTAAGKFLSDRRILGFPAGRIGGIMLIILAVII